MLLEIIATAGKNDAIEQIECQMSEISINSVWSLQILHSVSSIDER